VTQRHQPYYSELLLIDHVLLLRERQCIADIYPRQRYHQVINMTLLTIAAEEMPVYLWMEMGEPPRGEGESPCY
jgi:hypothetical protein